MKMIGRIFVAVLATLMVANSAWAQEEEEGPTSYGESTVELEIPKLVIIRGVADADLGTFDGQNAVTFTDPVSVSGNYASTPTYAVEATWSGNGSCSGTTHRIGTGSVNLNVTVEWDDEAAGTLTTLDCGASNDLTGQTLQDSTLSDPGAANSRWRVSATVNDMLAASAGDYSGVLRLTITPE
jgi:hypothetical protein